VRRRRFADLEGHDAYELLGVESTASVAEIQRAYRRMMLDTHPDVGGSEHRAKLVNCARDALIQDRAGYDAFRDRLERRTAAAANGARPETATEDRDEAVPQPASAESPFTEDDWADEDWDEDADPWADAEEGVGAPGQGADSPGAAWAYPEEDEPYRPFRPVPKRSLWSLLTTPPMLVLGVLVFGLIIAVLNAQGGGQTSTYSGTLPRSNYTLPSAVLPSRALPTDLYPTVSSPLSSILGIPGLTSLQGADHKCTIRKDDHLWCSGSNDSGELGVGDTEPHVQAVQVKGGHRWRKVAVGDDHTCALRFDRSLWCWGSNTGGQLGIGKGASSAVPRRVAAGRQWRSVAAYEDLNCAVTTGRTLWCWGWSIPTVINLIKTPSPADSRTPKRYGQGNTWLKVYSDKTSLCARRPRHPDTCWFFYSGQLTGLLPP
jgi:hypothetical protein